MVFRIVSRLAEPVNDPKGILPILRGIGRVRCWFFSKRGTAPNSLVDTVWPDGEQPVFTC